MPLQIYDEIILKLNQVVDVIGFISLDPILSTIHGSDDEMDEAEIQTHNPPASLVPRLHAVKIIELTKPKIINAPEIMSKAQLIRSDLHIVLSELMFGDDLAADYLLCHLLSTMYIFYLNILFYFTEIYICACLISSSVIFLDI